MTLSDVFLACSNLRDANEKAKKVCKSVQSFKEWGRRHCITYPSDTFLFEHLIEDLPVIDNETEDEIELELADRVQETENEPIEDRMQPPPKRKKIESLRAWCLESSSDSLDQSLNMSLTDDNLKCDWCLRAINDDNYATCQECDATHHLECVNIQSEDAHDYVCTPCDRELNDW